VRAAKRSRVTAPAVPVGSVVPGRERVGCLLIHGLTGTPAEMAPVADALAGRYPLWVTSVAGHGTTVTDLAATDWRDWYRSASAGADALLQVVRHLIVIGLSMGALLAIQLAIERSSAVTGLVLLSPAVELARGVPRWMHGPLRALGAVDARLPPLRAALARVIFAKGGSDIADADVRSRHPGYRHIPLRALLNLLALQRLALASAPAITQPTLVIHARQDHTVPVAAAEALFARIGAAEKRLVVLPDSFHVVTVDRERDRVRDEITAFVEARARAA